jgi:cyanophycinase
LQGTASNASAAASASTAAGSSAASGSSGGSGATGGSGASGASGSSGGSGATGGSGASEASGSSDGSGASGSSGGSGASGSSGGSAASSALGSSPPVRPGLLALVGGSEWTPGCEQFDSDLLRASSTREVLVLPTAAAYWHPERAVQTAASYFAALGASIKACMVLGRADAEDKANAGMVRAAAFVYLAGGSVLHLRSVLKSSSVWEALVEAWGAGAVLAGSSAGAMVLGDTMVDPRGGALTLGLGLLPQLAVLPHASTWSEEKTHRTVRLASRGLRIAAVDEQTALLRGPDGQWRQVGQGNVTVWLDGHPVGLEALEPEATGQAASTDQLQSPAAAQSPSLAPSPLPGLASDPLSRPPRADAGT